MKQRWKKPLSWLLTLSLVLSLIPAMGVTALADEEEQEPSSEIEMQDITQTGLDLTTQPTKETTYKAGEGTIVYTPTDDGATITLNNATIDVAETTYGTPGIALPNGDFNIVVPENTKSTISSIKKVSDTCQAITSPGGSVTISGGGTLDLNAYKAAVYVYDDDNGTLTIKDCTVKLHSAEECGAYVEHDIKLDHAKVTYSCDAEIDPDDGPYAIGLESTDGNVIISGSTYTFENSFYGVSADNQGAVIIRNSTVTGENCRSGFNVYPDANEDDTLKNLIENSDVHIEAKKAAFIDEGATEIKDSRVYMKSADDIAVDHWYDGISISGKSYVELEGVEHAAVLSDIQGKSDFTLGDGLIIVEGKINERVTSGKNQIVDTTPRLVIAASAVVTFDSQGGSDVEPCSTYEGGKATEPATAPTREGYNFAGWYSDASCKTAWNFDTDTVTKNMTLYAKWIPATTVTYTVSGVVEGSDGEDLSGTIVKLMQGDSIIASVTTGRDGTFTFTNLPAGHYNISAEKDDRGVTNEIIVSGNANDVVLNLPVGNIKTEVKVNENTPSTTVSGLDALAEVYAPTNTDVVRIVLNVAGKEESALPEETVSAIKNLSGSETLTYLEMDITRFVNNVSQGNITDTDPHLQSITIDFDTARKNISVYRVHNGTAAKLTVAGSTPADGTYRVNDSSITIYATKFSTYAIGYTTKSSGGHSSSGSATTYPVDVKSVTNGTIKADKSTASKDSTVTITVTPDKGYELGKLTVTDKNGKTISVTAKGNGQYTFTMPASGVTVTASFVETDWNLAYRNCPKDSTCPIWPFTDAKTTDWYHDGVHFCLENGLMVGYGNNIFQPDAGTTRAMIAVMLWRLNGSPVVNYAMNFEDVKADAWYTEAIRWAASEGVAAGYGNGKFGPDDAMTREQMVTILWRYAQYKGYDVSVGEDTNILSYDDATTVAQYAIPAMQWACGSGMVTGKTQGNGMILDPKGSTTRAQMATMMMRFCAEIVK